MSLNYFNQKYYEAQLARPAPPSKAALDAVRAYLRGEPGALARSTFRYLVHFMDTGEEADRFIVGAADFGFTLDDLRERRESGQTAHQLAQCVLNKFCDTQN